jgi:hypothetical protein
VAGPGMEKRAAAGPEGAPGARAQLAVVCLGEWAARATRAGSSPSRMARARARPALGLEGGSEPRPGARESGARAGGRCVQGDRGVPPPHTGLSPGLVAIGSSEPRTKAWPAAPWSRNRFLPGAGAGRVLSPNGDSGWRWWRMPTRQLRG